MCQVAGCPSDWQNGFMLIQGNRLEALCALMTTWLRRHPLHPLESEVILVQSNGIGQWLKLALAAQPEADPDEVGSAGGFGIAAAVDLTLPARFVWQAYRAVLGTLPDTSPYEKAPLTWRIYRLLADLEQLADGDEQGAWLAPLQGFLHVDDDLRRRYQLAERLADLYDQYQVYRADWLDAWARGDDVLIRPDGRRDPLPEGQRWQPLLWRRLAQDLRLRGPDDVSSAGPASRVEIHRRFVAQAATLDWSTRPDTVPRRIIVFGISSLPRQAIEVLQALAPVAQVMLFVHNPSRHYWGDIVEGRELFRDAYRRSTARKVPEAVDETALHLHGHPLLAAWGKQGRDYIRLLDEHDERERYEGAFQAERLAIDLFESPGSATLLQQLQDDILELRPVHERVAQHTRIDPARDGSLAFLIAHSPQREVEILHDQLLDAFAEASRAERPLAPRDILVMVPDIAAYAPHIEAVFGRLPADDARFIPFHIADRGRRQRQPVLIGLERLLRLPQSRFAVSELLDLLDIPALRARFGLEEADLPRLRHWIGGAGIRWGLDACQRAGLDLPEGLEQNTWQFGLERMLLGFAVGSSGPWRGVEPFDEVGGLEAALVGSLARLIETLARIWEALRQPCTPGDWGGRIAGLLDEVFCPVSEQDELALAQVRQALEQWTIDCTLGGVDAEVLPLEVVRDALLSRLDEPTLSQRFLAGAVSFATLMPMRAIPFRQIWLLGMNDGDYPRSRRPADFDLMAGDYRPGDRSRREDDRYLFLEALLSARERLVISWVGRSIRDNAERPPSVLVGQLRDHLAAGWQLDPAAEGSAAKDDGRSSGRRLVGALTTEHPLQPFSRRYFEPKRPATLFTYAGEWQAVHRRLDQEPEPPPRLAPPRFDAPIGLTTLGRFLRQPVATFYRARLAVALGEETEPVEDEEPFVLDGLRSWTLRHAILADIERQLVATPDVATDACLHSAIARRARAGDLPLPPFDAAWAGSLGEELAEPLMRFRELLSAYPQHVATESVHLAIDGLTVEDTLGRLRADAGARRLHLQMLPSRLYQGEDLKWHHLIRHWPSHLAAQRGAPTSTCLLGPGGEIWLRPLDADEAQTLLHELIAGFIQGVAELLPLACRTGFAELVAAADAQGRPKPREVYEGDGYHGAGEQTDHPAYRRFWPTYDALSGEARYRALVDRLYGPLFAHVSGRGERAE
jgi:exodeoxyribonuclease V gamma subunit